MKVQDILDTTEPDDEKVIHEGKIQFFRDKREIKDELQQWINDGTIDKIEAYFNNDEMRKDFHEMHLERLRKIGDIE